jgi:hypothetical protein
MPKTILSAPARGGFRQEFDTVEEAIEKAAELLGVDVATMIQIESPDGATTYCYASQAAADSDLDGAYAVQYAAAPKAVAE